MKKNLNKNCDIIFHLKKVVFWVHIYLLQIHNLKRKDAHKS